MPMTTPKFSTTHGAWGIFDHGIERFVNNDWHGTKDAAIAEFDEKILPIDLFGQPQPPRIVLRSNHPYIKRHPFFRTEGRKAIKIETTRKGTGIKRDRSGDKLSRVRAVIEAMPTAKLADLIAEVVRRNKEDISAANARYLVGKIMKESN